MHRSRVAVEEHSKQMEQPLVGVNLETEECKWAREPEGERLRGGRTDKA